MEKYGGEAGPRPPIREPIFEVSNVDNVDPGFKEGVEITDAYLHRVFAGLEPNARSERLRQERLGDANAEGVVRSAVRMPIRSVSRGEISN